MELTVTKREEKLGKLRRAKKIPCILYGGKKDTQAIYIDRAEYEAICRKLEEGQILTTKFTLKEGKTTTQAIIKDVQYHRTTYEVLHIDFMRLADDVKVKIKVPIRFQGASDCEGVKQGGVLKQPIRAVKVQCLPKDIPDEMYLDVRDIKLLQNKSLSSVAIPENVRPLLSLNEVIAVVAKR